MLRIVFHFSKTFGALTDKLCKLIVPKKPMRDSGCDLQDVVTESSVLMVFRRSRLARGRRSLPGRFVEQKPLVLSTHSITTATSSCRVFRLRFRAMWQHCRNPRVKGCCQAPTDVSQQPPDRQCGVSRSKVCSTIAPTASRKELLSVTDDTPRSVGVLGESMSRPKPARLFGSLAAFLEIGIQNPAQNTNHLEQLRQSIMGYGRMLYDLYAYQPVRTALIAH
jgi:hypothetical protein